MSRRDSVDVRRWSEIGKEEGWTLPKRPHWIVRLPIIRHVWVLWNAYQVDRHYSRGFGSIGIRTGYDEWALWGMWRNLWTETERE